MIRDEARRLGNWQEHHIHLVARLLLLLFATLVVDGIGSVLVFFLERHANGTEVTSYGDALFFTTVQLLTVSSQLPNPVTTGGRFVDVVLEIWAVVVVAGSAGAFASFLQNVDRASASN